MAALLCSPAKREPALYPATVHEQLRMTVYHVERTPYQKLHAEIEHPHWAVSHVAAGHVRTLTGGQEFSAAKGSVMVHPPFLPYAEYSEKPGLHEWIIFEARAGSELDFFQLYPVPAVVPLRSPGDFSRIFGELLDAWRFAREESSRELRIFSLTIRLLVMLVEDGRGSGTPSRPEALRTRQDRFVGMIHYMSAHLHRRITRGELARRFHLQPNYLDRVFRSAYGLAPLQMLRQLRIQRARHLLENTDETVETIAAACGYEDASRLTRAFGQVMGQPPGRYRRGVKSARNRYAQL